LHRGERSVHHAVRAAPGRQRRAAERRGRARAGWESGTAADARQESTAQPRQEMSATTTTLRKRSCPQNGNSAAKSEPEGISRLYSRLRRCYPRGDFLTPGVIAPAGFGQDKGDAKKGGDVAMHVQACRSEMRRGHNLRLGENDRSSPERWIGANIPLSETADGA